MDKLIHCPALTVIWTPVKKSGAQRWAKVVNKVSPPFSQISCTATPHRIDAISGSSQQWRSILCSSYSQSPVQSAHVSDFITFFFNTILSFSPTVI
jgi:hypothetical protein